jgi:hypothetical protein
VQTTSLEAVEVIAAELGTWAGAIGAAVHGAEQAAAIGATVHGAEQAAAATAATPTTSAAS